MRFIDFLLVLLFAGLMAFIYWQWTIVKNNPIEKKQQDPTTVQDSLLTDTLTQDTTFWEYDTLAISQYLDQLILNYKDTFPDTVVERLWGMLDSTVNEYPFSEYVKYNSKIIKENFYQLINLDDDNEKELLVQFYEYENTVYVFDRNNGIWAMAGIEKYEPETYYGTGSLPGELTTYPTKNLISIFRTTGHGTGTGSYTKSFYKIINHQLQKVLVLEDGYFLPPQDCSIGESIHLKDQVSSFQTIKVDYFYELVFFRCKDTIAPLYKDSTTVTYQYNNSSNYFELQDSVNQPPLLLAFLKPYKAEGISVRDLIPGILERQQKEGTPLQKELIKEYLRVFPPKEYE